MGRRIFTLLLLAGLLFGGYVGWKVFQVYVEKFQVEQFLREAAKKAVHPVYQRMVKDYIREKINENAFPFYPEDVKMFTQLDGTVTYRVTYSRTVIFIPEGTFLPPWSHTFVFTVQASARRNVW